MCVCGVWRVKNFWKPTRSAWGWCATDKFSNFQNFAANSKMFENFPANFKKFGRKLTHSTPYMYTRSALGGALWVSLKFQKKLNFVPA
jgi:hypothetical protein